MNKNFNTLSRQNCLLIVFFLILMGFIITYVRAAHHNFLPCEHECGETFLSEFAARNFRFFGSQFGFLEDLATSPSFLSHPQYYTHNVNIGGLSYIFLEWIGIKNFSSKQTFTMLIWALGLLYAYFCISYFSKSKLCGLFAVIFLITDFSFSHSFSSHALRTWGWLPIFGLPFHTSRFIFQKKMWDIVGIFALFLITFGVGYDFWIIMNFSSLFIILFFYRENLNGKKIEFVKRIAVFIFFMLLPFFLRQIHVIKVMGYDYWHVDFYYSIVIKIPFINQIFHIPSIPDLDAWYRSYNVMRPPAAPITSEGLQAILKMVKRSLLYVVLPTAGLLTSVATLLGIIIGILSPFQQVLIHSYTFFIQKTTENLGIKNLNISGLCTYIFCLTLGFIFGFSVTPNISILYLMYHPPLIVAPLFSAKSLIATIFTFIAFHNIYRKKYKTFCAVFLVLFFVFMDHALLQYFNTKHSKPMDTSWIPLIQSMPNSTFAVPYIQQSTSAFTNNWSIHVKGPGHDYSYFDLIEKGKPPFSKADLNFFGEKEVKSRKIDYTRPDYFLYYGTDQRIDVFDPEPECRRDYIISVCRQVLNKKPNGNFISDISFVPENLDNPMNFLVTGTVHLPFEIIDKVEINIGNDPPKKLIYNCMNSNFQGTYKISTPLKSKVPFQIYIKQKNNKIDLVYSGIIEANSLTKGLFYEPRIRQPLVSEILEKYKDINIVQAKKGQHNYDGYILIDLREINKKQTAALNDD